MRVADFIARRLQFLGLQDVYMVTGGAAMHLNDAFASTFASDVHCLHHEQSCAMAADSYARIKGIPAIVNVTAGPGAINAINGVFGAFVDSIPSIIVSGQAKRETLVSTYDDPNLRQLGDQEVDIVRMVEGVCKFSKVVRNPYEIDEIINNAFLTATSGRPGPVWIDVPIDVQATPLPEDFNSKIYTQIDSSTNIYTPSIPFASNNEIYLLAQRILASKRPIIYAGNGIRLSKSYDQFLDFLDQWNIPTVTAWNSNDLLWDDHPCYAGRPGTVGNRAGNFAVQFSDCVVILGSRLNIRLVSFNWKSFAKSAWKCHVDIDQSELSKPTLNTDLKIHSTLYNFLPELSKALQESLQSELSFKNNRKTWSDWKSFNKKYLDIYAPHKHALPPKDSKVNPYRLVNSLSDKLQENDIVVTADGTACVVGFQASSIKKGQRWFHNSGCASMGFELPAAIGAWHASGQSIICIAGDGSIMMNLQELAYIGGLNLPIKIILLNNQGYHSIRQTQKNYFPANPVGCGVESGLPFPDFDKLCSGFGLSYFHICDENHISGTLDKLLTCEGACLLEVILDLDQEFSPKLASKKLEDGSMVTADLEDMTPLLGDDILKSIMNQAYQISDN